MQTLEDLFRKAVDIAAQRGEYTEDMMLTAKLDPDITIYARIHACSEVLVYVSGRCVFHSVEGFSGQLSTLGYRHGEWVNLITNFQF